MRIRISGFLLAMVAGGLGLVGYWLCCLALNWTMRPWVPEAFRVTPQGPELPWQALQDRPVGWAAA